MNRCKQIQRGKQTMVDIRDVQQILRDAKKIYDSGNVRTVEQHLDVAVDFFDSAVRHGNPRSTKIILATRAIDYAGLVEQIRNDGWTVIVDNERKHHILHDKTVDYVVGTA